MSDRIRYQETANGPAYTLGRVTLIFAYGGFVWLPWADGSLSTVEYPDRFGPFETPEQRRAYIRAFVGSAS